MNIKQLVKNAKQIAFNKNNDLSTEEGRSNERLKRVTWTSIAALFAQVLQMAIPLITVRITLDYMGDDVYALWTTVNSLFALMAYADMGLGNGLQTKLSQETGKKENFRGGIVVSSTYFILSVIALIFGVVFGICYPLLNWGKIVGTAGTHMEALTGSVVLAIIVPKIISIPCSLIRRCQYAMQDGFVAYMWQAMSSILSIVSIYITIALDRGVVAVIWVSSCLPIVIYLLNSVTYFRKHRQIRPRMKDVNLAESRLMLKLGIGFFVLSILNTLGLNMDNYIVAKASSVGDVTMFGIALRVTQLINVACTVLSAPLWAANGEALANGDIDWIKRVTRKMSLLSVGIVALASVVLLSIGPWLFQIWLKHDIGINRFLLLGLLCMQLAFAFVSPYFMVLNASGQIRIQIILFAIFTPVSIAVKYFICSRFGIPYMAFAGAVIYVVMVAIPVYITTNKLYKKIRMKD